MEIETSTFSSHEGCCSSFAAFAGGKDRLGCFSSFQLFNNWQLPNDKHLSAELLIDRGILETCILSSKSRANTTSLNLAYTFCHHQPWSLDSKTLRWKLVDFHQLGDAFLSTCFHAHLSLIYSQFPCHVNGPAFPGRAYLQVVAWGFVWDAKTQTVGSVERVLCSSIHRVSGAGIHWNWFSAVWCCWSSFSNVGWFWGAPEEKNASDAQYLGFLRLIGSECTIRQQKKIVFWLWDSGIKFAVCPRIVGSRKTFFFLRPATAKAILRATAEAPSSTFATVFKSKATGYLQSSKKSRG